MLTWTLICFVVVVLAGIFGFAGIAAGAAAIAQTLFYLLLVLFLISSIDQGMRNASRGRPPL